MNKAADICKKNELWELIKRVSDYYGGDDPNELKEFAKELIANHTVDEALVCFRDIAKHCIAVTKKAPEVDEIKVESFKYQPPFYDPKK